MIDAPTIYDIPVTAINGTTTTLAAYEGKTLLIVNVASKCGFTKQYTGLEHLYKKYHDKGFEILGFPCNQFGGQEPGNEEEIQKFCKLNYDVTFPLFAKIDVNGKDASPLYDFLKTNAKGILGSEAIKWNFTKFLVDKQGHVLHRYAPATTPEELEKDIVEAL
jgi:glutathione peroxidase